MRAPYPAPVETDVEKVTPVAEPEVLEAQAASDAPAAPVLTNPDIPEGTTFTKNRPAGCFAGCHGRGDAPG